MMFSEAERVFVAAARVGRLATADADGRPHVVPLCFAFVEERIVSAIDVKPKRVEPMRLRRVRNIRANPSASLLVDRYVEDWEALAWVRVDGEGRIEQPGSEPHTPAVDALRAKYEQYREHPLEDRPILLIEPERVRSWGSLEPR